MGLEDIMLNEISQTKRHILCDITYIWNLKNTTSEYNKREAENHQNKLVVAGGEGQRGNIRLGSGRYKLLGVR